MKTIVQICTQTIAIVVTIWCGDQIPTLLFLSGVTGISRIHWWSIGFLIFYFGVTLGSLAIGLAMALATAKSRDGRLVVGDNGAGAGFFRYWRMQNIVLALLCVAIWLFLRLAASSHINGLLRT